MLVGVEADELVLFLDVDLAGDVILFLEGQQAAFQAVGEGVAHGDELDVLVRLEGLRGGAGAAAAAADQADLEDIAAGGVGGGNQCGGRQGCRGFEKIAPRRVVGVHGVLL